MANRNAARLEIVQTQYVYSQIVRRDTLAVEWVNTANFAKEMPSGLRVVLIFSKRVAAGEKNELAFVNLDHQRVFSSADRAVTLSELWEIRFDLESDTAAMTAAGVFS